MDKNGGKCKEEEEDEDEEDEDDINKWGRKFLDENGMSLLL